MSRIETDRLILRQFAMDDAGFVLELLNDPAWLQHIGDRGVRTLADARAYLRKGRSPVTRETASGLTWLS